MNHWESLVEKRIREAMEQGEFDNLPGKGQPVDTSENPFEDPELRMAHRLLRNAGFAPAWIEERKDIDTELERARTKLTRARALHNDAQSGDAASAAAAWQRSLIGFHEQIADLNKRILVYNLTVPAFGFQRPLISAAREIEATQENE